MDIKQTRLGGTLYRVEMYLSNKVAEERGLKLTLGNHCNP